MKRFLALLLVLCLVLPLAACGGTTETTEATEATEATETTETTEETTLLEDIVNAVTVQDGETYDFASHLPLTTNGETITIGLIVDANTTDYKDNAFTKWVEEQTGVNLEFMQFTGKSSDAATQLSLMMASGEKLPDIILRFTGVSKTQGAEFGRDGYFKDLSAYFADPEMNYYRRWRLNDSLKGDYNEHNRMLMIREMDTETGAMYAYPRMEDSIEDRPRSHVAINKLWLEKLGLEEPRTIEELRTVLEAFRDQDPNGNGVADEIPLTGKASGGFRDVISWIINAFVYVHDGYYYNVTDGQVWAPYTTDEYRQALIYIREMVDDGLIIPQTWTMETSELKSLINPIEGEPYKAGIITANVYADIQPGSPAMGDYATMHPLKDATGKGGYGPRDYVSMEYNTFITEDCENPELAFKLLDFFCSPESQIRARWGEEGIDWEMAEPGKTGNLGGEAVYKILADDPQTYANNKTWHNYMGITSSMYSQKEIDLSNPDDFLTQRYVRDSTIIQYYDEAGQPEELFNFGIYTTEENDFRDEFVGDLTTYIKNARAEFCTGNSGIDPRNDADWNKYLSDLESLRLADWIASGQTAYDRVANAE